MIRNQHDQDLNSFQLQLSILIDMCFYIKIMYVFIYPSVCKRAFQLGIDIPRKLAYSNSLVDQLHYLPHYGHIANLF